MKRVFLILLGLGAIPCLAAATGGTIFDAIKEGNAENAVRMAKEGQVNTRDRDGRTPLMLAAEQGEGALVEALVAGGADFDARDNFGFTVIDHLESILRRVGESRTRTAEAMRRQGLSEKAIQELLAGSGLPQEMSEDQIRRVQSVLDYLRRTRDKK